MGYRSEVGIKCQKNAYEMFKKAWEKEKFEPDQIRSDGKMFIIYWDWVKWYEDYPDIKAIEDVMNELDQITDEAYEKEMGYKFIRLGEDDSDVEQRENSLDIDFWYIREIDFEDMPKLER